MVNCLVQLIGTCSNCARVAYNSQFAESKLDRVTGGFCGILLNRLITAGSGGTAPLTLIKIVVHLCLSQETRKSLDSVRF